MKGQTQTQNYGFTAISVPKNIVILLSSTQKYGWQLYFSHKLHSKELFLRYYIIELRENVNCWNFLIQTNAYGKFMFANFRPKSMASKWNFRLKNMARIPPYTNMVSTPPPGYFET